MPLPEPAPPVDDRVPVRVWDLPTRLFHAALAVGVAAAVATAEIGGSWMAWHLRCGEAVLALLAFRWAWGVVGGRWSRFASFLPSPARIARHLRGRPGADDAARVGHNPLGALSVWAVLVVLTVQVATGLVADDEIDTTGPLNAHVSGRLAQRASRWHAGWGADAVFVLVGLHLAAVAWHAWRGREPLVRAMWWTGDKPAPPGTPASRDTRSTRLAGLAVAALAAGGTWALVRWGGG